MPILMIISTILTGALADTFCTKDATTTTIAKTADELWLNGGCQEFNLYYIPKAPERKLSTSELNSIVGIFNEASTDPKDHSLDEKMKTIIQTRFQEFSKGCRNGVSKDSLKATHDDLNQDVVNDLSDEELKKYSDLFSNAKNPDFKSKKLELIRLVGKQKVEDSEKALLNQQAHHDVKSLAKSQDANDIKAVTHNPNKIFEACDSNDLTILQNNDVETCGTCAGGFKKQFKDNAFELDDEWKKTDVGYQKFKTCIEATLKAGCEISKSEIYSSASLYENTMDSTKEKYCGPTDFECLSKLRAESTLDDIKNIVKNSGASATSITQATTTLASSKLNYKGSNCNGSSGPCPWNQGKRVPNPNYEKEDFDDFKYVKVSVFFKNSKGKSAVVSKNVRMNMNCQQVRFKCAGENDPIAGEPVDSKSKANNISKTGWKKAPGPDSCVEKK